MEVASGVVRSKIKKFSVFNFRHLCTVCQNIFTDWFIFVLRDDDSDDEIDDQDIHKIMIVTQTPPPVKKHDRTGSFVTRVKMTQELSKAINDGLFYYEQVWKKVVDIIVLSFCQAFL